jgi:tetratricopeptide (TPR) repeat protein
VYARVLTCDFVGYDDDVYVTKNPRVQAGLTPESLRWAFTTGHAGNWHPLTWTAHMIDFRVFGFNPRGHHAASLLLHTAATLLLFWFLRRATGAWGRSLFVAAVFALHPLHVESVAWVAERKDVLSGLFWMLALIAYARYVRKPGVLPYLLVLLLLVLGLLSKPMVVTLPFVFLLLDYWPFDRVTAWRQVPGLIIEKGPMFALAAASSAATFVAQKLGGAVSTLQQVPLSTRVENTPIAYVTYLIKMICPTGLAVLYPFPKAAWPIAYVAGATFLLAGITLAVLWSGRRRRYLATGWLWYLGTLVPVIGLVQIGSYIVADRYTYLPSIGLAIAVAWGLSELTGGRRARKRALTVAGAAAIVVCGAISFHQIGYWRDAETLLQRAVRVTSDNSVAHYNLGCVYLGQKRYKEAAAEFSDALRIEPGDIECMSNLAKALTGLGRSDDAIDLYAKALRLKPDYVTAQINLGVMLSFKGRLDEAVRRLFRAVDLSPDNPDARYNLGVALFKQGKLDDAQRHLAEALRFRPDDVDTLYAMGQVLLQQQRYAEAEKMLERVLQINPAHKGARQALEILRTRR